MTYKLLRHKDFTAEWEKLPVAIRDQFKKKLAKVIEQPHIPKNMLRGDLAGCYNRIIVQFTFVMSLSNHQRKP